MDIFRIALQIFGGIVGATLIGGSIILATIRFGKMIYAREHQVIPVAAAAPAPVETSLEVQLAKVCSNQERQTEVLVSMAEYLFEVARQQKRLTRIFKGDAYEEVDDPRARKIEEVNEQMEKYGYSREEATARVEAQRTYSRDGLGLKGSR